MPRRGKDHGHDAGRQGGDPAADRDYTPFATKLKDANPSWIFSWAPWVTQVKTLEALRRLGWKGDYIAWRISRPRASWRASRMASSNVIGAIHCSRTTCRSTS